MKPYRPLLMPPSRTLHTLAILTVGHTSKTSSAFLSHTPLTTLHDASLTVSTTAAASTSASAAACSSVPEGSVWLASALDDGAAVLCCVHAVQHGPGQHEHCHPAHVAAVRLEQSDGGAGAEQLLLVSWRVRGRGEGCYWYRFIVMSVCLVKGGVTGWGLHLLRERRGGTIGQAAGCMVKRVREGVCCNARCDG